MSRVGQALSTLAAAFRNANLRRVQLAWGAAIAAEWAHFVALGVFAYEHRRDPRGRRRRASSACCPLRSSPRSPHPWVTASVVSASCSRWRSPAAWRSSVRRWRSIVEERGPRLRARRRPRPGLDALQAGPPGTAAVTRSDSRGADRCQRRYLDDREPRDAHRPARRRRPRHAFGRRGRVHRRSRRRFSRPPGFSLASGSSGRLEVRAEPGSARSRSVLWAGFRLATREPKRSTCPLPRSRADVRAWLPERADRGCRLQVFDAGAGAVGYMTAAIGVGGLFGALWATTFGAGGSRCLRPCTRRFGASRSC